MPKAPPDIPEDISRVLDAYPKAIKQLLLKTRALIYDVAAEDERIGPLSETLKWNEPAYRPLKNNIGSTVRLAWKEKTPGELGVYFICNTNLVDRFRTQWGDTLKFEGNRAIKLPHSRKLPTAPLADCIRQALTYHLDK